MDPSDATSARRLTVSEHLLALDPTRPGLRSAERYRRSRDLLEAVLAATELCVARSGTGSATLSQDVAAARPAIRDRRGPPARGEDTERNLQLAQRLWRERLALCGSGDTQDDAVAMIMGRLASRASGSG
jgi:hypothetical protein